MNALRNLFTTRRSSKRKPAPLAVRPQLEALEHRWVPATIGVTKYAALDFDGEFLSSTHLNEGGWGGMSGVSLGSFHSLFTNARPWLDMNGDATVNSIDANLAIAEIMDMVKEDYKPYRVSIFEMDQDSSQTFLTDSIIGDVTVIITGGVDTDFMSGLSAWGVAPWADAGNNDDEMVFVFGGGSVDSFAWNADGWFNQIARTISHEMGHAFGLEHQVGDGGALTDTLSHSIMGTPNRDWNRDFVFVDKWLDIDGGGTQNAHRELLKEDVLGRSFSSYIAVHRPGELTVAGNGSANNIQVYQVSASQWQVIIDGVTTFIDLNSVDIHSLNPFDQPITSIKILGEGGNDYLYVSVVFNSMAYVYGGDGDDTIYGGAASDVLYGDAGNDYLYGRGGNDVVVGGDGNDTMYGHDGDDWLIGGYGNDYLRGGNGNDWLFGQEGYDILYGDAGNDFLSGGLDGIADYLNGGTGADRFEAEWYWAWSGWFFTQKNRDNPADFNAGAGDTLV